MISGTSHPSGDLRLLKEDIGKGTTKERSPKERHTHIVVCTGAAVNAPL